MCHSERLPDEEAPAGGGGGWIGLGRRRRQGADESIMEESSSIYAKTGLIAARGALECISLHSSTPCLHVASDLRITL